MASSAVAARKIHVGGAIVVLDPDTFIRVSSGLRGRDKPLMHRTIGIASKSHLHLLPCGGVTFAVKFKGKLPPLPGCRG